MALIKTTFTVVGLLIVLMLLITTLRLFELKRNITEYKQYWDKQNERTAKNDSILFVVLGDSAAQGIGASKPTKGYVGLLASYIADKSERPVHIVNLSVSGAKVQDVLQTQLPKLQQMNLPNGSIVTVAVGANDLANFDHVEFKDNIEELFRQLPPQTIVADIPYFGGGRVRSLESNAVSATKIIHDTASKFHLRVAQLHDTTRRLDSIWTYGPDFFHPNDNGYINWFKAFQAALAS